MLRVWSVSDENQGKVKRVYILHTFAPIGSPRVQQNGQNGDYLQNRANALSTLICVCAHISIMAERMNVKMGVIINV